MCVLALCVDVTHVISLVVDGGKAKDDRRGKNSC